MAVVFFLTISMKFGSVHAMTYGIDWYPSYEACDAVGRAWSAHYNGHPGTRYSGMDYIVQCKRGEVNGA